EGSKSEANRWVADPGERSPHVPDLEFRRCFVKRPAADPLMLAPDLRPSPRGHPAFEVLVRRGEDSDQVLGPGPDRMAAVMPAALRLFERRVVGVLGLVDSLLDADVAGGPVIE